MSAPSEPIGVGGNQSGPLVAFLGPSLGAADATSIVPDVRLYPPICQGDLTTVVEQVKPRAVLIVDGEFGQSLSVWHKEILAALRAGVRIVGASSMGALRAAELDRYGMEGVGAIYAHYRDGWMTDDADVALLHGDADSDYRSLTWPLVNVRATVDALRRAGSIDDDEAKLIGDAAQAVHFTERGTATLERQLRLDGLVTGESRRLATMIAAGYVDQKAADTVAGFEHLAHIDEIPPPVAETPLHIDAFTYTCMRASDTAIERNGVSMRRYQLVFDVALHEPDFDRLFDRALERFVLTNIAEDYGVAPSADELAEQRRRVLLRLDVTEDSLDAWLADNDLDAARFDELVEQEAIVRRFHRWAHDLQLFDRGRRLVIEQLQLEGKYPAAVTAAAKRRQLIDSRPNPTYPRSVEDITKLVVRHHLRTGWRATTELPTWAEDHCFDGLPPMLLALADADVAHTALQERGSRVARALGINMADAEGENTERAKAVAATSAARLRAVQPSPGTQVHSLLEAHQFTAVLLATVELDLHTALASGRRTLSELAAATGSVADRLQRLLRGLQAIAIVDFDERGGWGLTAAGRSLVSGGRGRDADTNEYGLEEYAQYVRADLLARWESLADVVRGADVPPYPDDELTVNAIASLTLAHDHVTAVVKSIDASPGARVVDVGGGVGLLAEALHAARPDLSVGLVELPCAARHAAARLAERGLDSAIDVVAYTGQPALDRPANCCVLVRVLGNLGDEQAVELLGFVQRSLAPGGTVDVIDMRHDGGMAAGLGDLLNLVRTGGGVRSLDEWQALALGAGLHLVSVTPIQPPFSRLRFAAVPTSPAASDIVDDQARSEEGAMVP
jgi:hypothetical protein